jgi:hypothetical protein
LDKDWKKFLKSESLNAIKGIVQNGDKLIWNKYNSKEQLNKTIEVVNTRLNNFQKIKELENNTLNKKLNHLCLLLLPKFFFKFSLCF